MYVLIAVGFREFDRLLEVLPFFDELEPEQVAAGLDFLTSYLKLSLLSRRRVVYPYT